MPGLERLVSESRIPFEVAQNIINTHLVSLEIGKMLGMIPAQPQGIINGLDLSSQSQSAGGPPIVGMDMIPLNFSKYQSGGGASSSGVGRSVSPNFGGGGSYSNSNSGCASPCYSNYNSGCPSPNYGGAGGASPMHQITKGISGLTTGGGSITRGTSAVAECTQAAVSSQPLDLSMDVNESIESFTTPSGTAWYVPASFYDLKPLNLSPAQQVRVVPTPPASPNLCIIQEELHPSHSASSSSYSSAGCSTATIAGAGLNDDLSYVHSHPQICLTDVQGSEITLVALSDSSSRDSDDSLDLQSSSITLQGLVITEPSDDMPSITRGVAGGPRKTSLESDANGSSSAQSRCLETENTRRGSDKSLGFSDDSLSNDSNNLSPQQEPASGSSGFKSGGDSHSELERLSPDSLSEFKSDEYYELPLPHECSNLDSTHILELIKKTIYTKMPPKGFVNNQQPSTSSSSMDISNLSLEYSGGLQIELQVCEGRGGKDNVMGGGKGIKLRRISGDQCEYGKLCQQLISSLTV